jgi:hypothetical protein
MINLNLTDQTTVVFDIVNDGQTPAYKVAVRSALGIAPTSLPQHFQFPDPPEVDTTLTIPPHGAIRSRAFHRPFGPDELTEIEWARDHKLYLFGQVDYLDAFKIPRCSQFCCTLPGGIVTALNHPKIRDHPVSFAWEICDQHNDSD